jgi:hypothetical protein
MVVASPLNIGKSTNPLRSVGGAISGANRTIKNIGGILFRRTKFKRESIATSKTLTNKRIENENRADRESELEAPNLTKTPAGASNLANNSGGSFLDRIVGFLGYTTAGWILNNLPTWIGLGKEFIARIQKAGQIISSVANDAINIVGGFGNVLGAVGKNILSFDILDSSKRLQNAVGDLNASFEDMGKQFNDGFKLVSTPLTTKSGEGSYSGANVPSTGTPSPDQGAYPETPMPSGGGGGGGKWKSLLDLMAVGESSTDKKNNGYDAQNRAPGGVRPGLSQMTIGEIARNAPGASGRYQQMPQFLLGRAKAAGYNQNTIFSPAVQDALAVKLIEGRGGNAWLRGKMSTEDFMQGLSQEWASVPNAYGRFAYGGQSGPVTANQIKKVLAQIKGGGAEQPAPAQVSSSPGSNASIKPQNKGNVLSEYITGDPNNSHYSRDHGGPGYYDNYHDHLAFKDKETTLNAYNFFKSKGFTVTELNASSGHVDGSLHYSGRAFDIPGYQWGGKKGTPAGSKEFTGSAKVRATLAQFLGSSSSLGGSSNPAAQVASTPSSNAPQQLTPERTGQDIFVFDTGAGQSPPPAAPSGGGGGGAPAAPDNFTMVNNFIKKQLLLDLVYL